MASIFVSYRRSDTGSMAGRLGDRLKAAFDTVFVDHDALNPGDDFPDEIHGRLATCDAVLVLIGKTWLAVLPATGHCRLFDKGDWVCTEVANALAQRRLVIPVLVDGAPPPKAEQLPPSIHGLAVRHAYEFNTHHFDRDADDLNREVEDALRHQHCQLSTPALKPLTTQLQWTWMGLLTTTFAPAIPLLNVPWYLSALTGAMTITTFLIWLYTTTVSYRLGYARAGA